MAAEVPEPLALSIPAAGHALSLSPQSVRRRIADGTLASVRIGGRVLVPRKAIDDLLERKAS